MQNGSRTESCEESLRLIRLDQALVLHSSMAPESSQASQPVSEPLHMSQDVFLQLGQNRASSSSSGSRQDCDGMGHSTAWPTTGLELG